PRAPTAHPDCESMKLSPNRSLLVGIGFCSAHVKSLEQPLSALSKAVTISSTVICPSWLLSPAMQSATAALPSAMFTMVRISSTVTCESALQSPTQLCARAEVGRTITLIAGAATSRRPRQYLTDRCIPIHSYPAVGAAACRPPL